MQLLDFFIKKANWGKLNKTSLVPNVGTIWFISKFTLNLFFTKLIIDSLKKVHQLLMDIFFSNELYLLIYLV